jgi:alkanesulfonate monooxygenase SsuD/methylene tetrahydromethanopterin reductase-like flavin-dependent oxidoreductase (luciferase family)
MRVCLMIEGQEDVTFQQWLGLAGACEEHGLEGLFRSDHYGSVMGMPERGSLDAWSTLAALAARTSRIRLGTLVSPVTFRHPSVLAKNVVTVDHVSGGRVELGLGAGWNVGEHRAYGFEMPPTATRVAVLAEQLEIVHRSRTCAPCPSRCSARIRRCWSAGRPGHAAWPWPPASPTSTTPSASPWRSAGAAAGGWRRPGATPAATRAPSASR